jgi:hypothetical protein
MCQVCLAPLTMVSIVSATPPASFGETPAIFLSAG